jgi:small subunit ribosomal protein S10
MKFRLYLKSFDKDQLITSSYHIKQLLEKGNCTVNHFIALPRHKRKFCVIRSPHVDKDSREQFEVTTHKRFLDIEISSPQMIESLLSIEIPSGVYCLLKVLNY